MVCWNYSDIHHTLFLDTNFTSLLRTPRFYRTRGTLGPKTHATSQLFLRDTETTHGVSFDTQSQSPEIPDISSCNQLSQTIHTLSRILSVILMICTFLHFPLVKWSRGYTVTKCHSYPLFIPIVSQDYTHWTPSHMRKKPNQGFCRSVVHVQRLWIRFVRQDLSCGLSGDFGICLLIWVCFFNDSLRSTLYTFLYVSFA